MNALFSIRVTEADLEALDKATDNRSLWIREAVTNLLEQEDREKLVASWGGKFGEGYKKFVPVILSTEIAKSVSELADVLEVKQSQIVRASIRRRLGKSNGAKTNARRR